MQALFVYGSLIEPDVQRGIIGRLITGTPDTLSDYARREVDFGPRSYPMIYPAAGQRVAGHILHVTADELERIDAYETSAYERVRVTLVSGLSAWVYRAAE